MGKQSINWHDWCISTSTIITAIGTIFGLGLIFYQLMLSNKLKQFENYNLFNKIYDDWYANMPDEVKDCHGRSTILWNSLENNDRAWIRRYFNLYAQEYYFYKNKMIPKEMWEGLIHGKHGCNGAAITNLREYPILLEGYKKWKEKGAFNHPDDFTKMLDKKIQECQKEINAPLECTNYNK